jgi:hypothetical protein
MDGIFDIIAFSLFVCFLFWAVWRRCNICGIPTGSRLRRFCRDCCRGGAGISTALRTDKPPAKKEDKPIISEAEWLQIVKNNWGK